MVWGPRVVFLSNAICITAQIQIMPTSGPTSVNISEGWVWNFAFKRTKTKQNKKPKKTGVPDGI